MGKTEIYDNTSIMCRCISNFNPVLMRYRRSVKGVTGQEELYVFNSHSHNLIRRIKINPVMYLQLYSEVD